MSRKENIRLLVDAHLFDQEFQGTRTFLRELYRELLKLPGLEIFFAAVDTAGLQETFPGVPPGNFIRLKSPGSLFRLLVDIPRIIKHYRIDYAHFQYIVPPLKHCRYIVTTHDVIFREHPREFSFFYRFFKTLLYRYGATQADLLTTVSGYSAGSISKYLGIAPGKILLTPLAVDEAFFVKHDKAEARKLFAARYGFDQFILCVSRFEARKNHALLLRIYLDQRLYLQGYYLVMLGHRSLPVAEFDALLKGIEPDIRSFVVIRSDVPDEELPLFYQAARLFVYPSKAEGFGLPPLEAAAAQTPVICSNATGMAAFDFFDEAHIDPTDHIGFTACLLRMIASPPTQEKLSGIANTIRMRYSWQASAESVHAALLANAAQATPIVVSS